MPATLVAMSIISMEGYGTDAYLHLNRLGQRPGSRCRGQGRPLRTSSRGSRAAAAGLWPRQDGRQVPLCRRRWADPSEAGRHGGGSTAAGAKFSLDFEQMLPRLMMPCGRGVAERSYTCLLPPLAAQRAYLYRKLRTPLAHPPTLPALVLGTPMHRTASHFLGLPHARPCPSSRMAVWQLLRLSSSPAAAPSPSGLAQPTFSCNLTESHLVSSALGSVLCYYTGRRPAARG